MSLLKSYGTMHGVISPRKEGITIPGVPCVVDSSTYSDLRECEGAIVMCLEDRIWSRVTWFSKLPVGAESSYHNPISRLVGVFLLCGILTYVVLDDAVHFLLFNVMAIGYKQYVYCSRALRPKTSCVGVTCVMVCTIEHTACHTAESTCCHNPSVIRQILASKNGTYSNHFIYYLVDMFNDGFCL